MASDRSGFYTSCSCGAISKLLSERLQTLSIARWRCLGSSVETSDCSPAGESDKNAQRQLPTLLPGRQHLEEDHIPKPSQLGCCLREERDVKIQTQEHLQTPTRTQKALLTQAQACFRTTAGAEMAFGVRKVDSSGQSSAVSAVPTMQGLLANFPSLKTPVAGSDHIYQAVLDAAGHRVLDMPAAVRQVVHSNCCDQSHLIVAKGEAPNMRSFTIRRPEHAQAAAWEGAASCAGGDPAKQFSVPETRSWITTTREPRPMMQECSPCRPQTRQFPLLVRQDELTLVGQQAHQVEANNKDWQAPSLRLTSQEFEVWLQPGPLGVYVADVQTGHVTEVFDGQVKTQGVRPGFQFLTLDGEPYSEVLLERKVNGSAPYRVVFKQLLDQQHQFAPEASAAVLPRRVPSLTSYVPQTDVLRGCQSFGTQALRQ